MQTAWSNPPYLICSGQKTTLAGDEATSTAAIQFNVYKVSAGRFLVFYLSGSDAYERITTQPLDSPLLRNYDIKDLSDANRWNLYASTEPKMFKGATIHQHLVIDKSPGSFRLEKQTQLGASTVTLTIQAHCDAAPAAP